MAGSAATFGYLFWRTISHTGPEAVAQMSAEEKEWLQRLGGVHSAMSAAEVYKLLGEPTSELVVVAQWDDFAGSRLSRLRIGFSDGRPRNLRWLKLGYFVYEKRL